MIGIAGGPDKCAWISTELRFDAAIDYENQHVATELRRHAPSGLDVYFDNVGGEVLDAALTRLARGARVVICAATSQYNAPEIRGPRNYLMLLVSRASMTVFDYLDRYAEARGELARWLRSGELVSRENVVQGAVEHSRGLPEAVRRREHRKARLGTLVTSAVVAPTGTPAAPPLAEVEGREALWVLGGPMTRWRMYHAR